MFLQLRDGRLLMLLNETQTNAVAVWEVPIDSSSGVARGSPRRLTEGGRAAHPLAQSPGSGSQARRRMESVSS